MRLASTKPSWAIYCIITFNPANESPVFCPLQTSLDFLVIFTAWPGQAGHLSRWFVQVFKGIQDFNKATQPAKVPVGLQYTQALWHLIHEGTCFRLPLDSAMISLFRLQPKWCSLALSKCSTRLYAYGLIREHIWYTYIYMIIYNIHIMHTYYIIECTVQSRSNSRHFLMWLPSSAIRNRLVDGCTLVKPVVMVQKKHNQHILTAKTPHVDRQARCRLGVALLGAGQPEEPSFWLWILAPHPQYIKLYVLHSYL